MDERITPCLWFDFNAEDAVAHYLSVFPDARVVKIARFGEGGPGPAGAVMTIALEIEGQKFLALNGGPQFQFTPAISLVVNCDSQAEIDRYWERLSEDGQKGRCGWLTDRFGVSWQIVPRAIGVWMADGDAKATARVMKAVQSMDKLDMVALQNAFEAKEERTT
jgi:predicted 3-demethylubiquinone-9 3-methyltransferase (glyoxalase superfamily)